MGNDHMQQRAFLSSVVSQTCKSNGHVMPVDSQRKHNANTMQTQCKTNRNATKTQHALKRNGTGTF